MKVRCAPHPATGELASHRKDDSADGTDGNRVTEEQAALRRVAMLAARGASPEEMFAAVAAEV
ncbi:MAG TPA: hypothetical protein VKV38_01785, partial [Trebonia sp.]|nr:hypothetical protein [Trebonia sp.]